MKPGNQIYYDIFAYFITAVLMITASHQTFSSQLRCLSGLPQFDRTHLLYIINGKVIIFINGKVMVMSGQISILIISTVTAIPSIQ